MARAASDAAPEIAMPPMANVRQTQPLRVDLSRKRLPRWFADRATRCLHWLLGFNQFNALYARLPACKPENFSRVLLDALNVHLEMAGQPLESIPADGPLIVVANHPYGLLDGMTVETLLRRVRPDVTVMAIHLLAMIPEYRERWIFVGRLGSRSKRKLSQLGWRRSFQWLAIGGSLVMFPAGRVSRFQWRSCSIADRPWSTHIGAIARRSGAAVLPIRLYGPSFWGSRLFGIFVPLLQNIRSLGAIDKFRGRTFHASIGPLISPAELQGFFTDEQATSFLRCRVDELGRSR